MLSGGELDQPFLGAVIIRSEANHSKKMERMYFDAVTSVYIS